MDGGTTTERVYTALFPFGGIGGGALGFQRAEAELRGLGWRGTFRVLGGIDFDAQACEDFEALTGAPSLRADLSKLTADELRAFAGETAPDVVFLSPPCKGASGLLSEERARSPKYAAMNELALCWTRTMLAAWPTPPRLVLLENVPRLAKRAAGMLREVRRLLRAAGYVIHEGAHDCGEIGGLAQHRDRFLLVARHARRVDQLLYQPPKRRVRACGEVLGELPLPGDPSAGPLHVLPRISMLNWARLAAIPPGGDWRDLPRGTIAGRTPFNHVYSVLPWTEPAGAVNGGAGPTSGAASVADERVRNFGGGPYGVVGWDSPSGVVTGNSWVTAGRFSVADLRVPVAHPRSYGVMRWTDPSNTVAAGSHPGQGAYSVADLRLTCTPRETSGAYGVRRWTDAWVTVTGSACIDNGWFAVADPRVPGNPTLSVRWVVRDLRAAPPYIPVLPTVDGSWHRPLTTLELAVLQGFPATINGRPLTLAGKSSSRWREALGNAVPVGAAEAIARQMLLTLVHADAGVFALSSGGGVWVREQCAGVQ